MPLFHFTARHLAKRIKKEGITKGAIPNSLNPPRIETGYIWLTTNESFDQPCLVGTGLLNYSRTEVRISVVVPKYALDNLLKFDEHKSLTPLYDDLTKYGDPENWYVFKGIIPNGWLREFKSNKGNRF